MNETKNRRILIVDDNPAIHDDFRKIIGARPGGADVVGVAGASLFFDVAPPPDEESPGYELDSAFQGAEALARVEENLRAERPYAMAFVDIRMPPGLHGVETVHRIWEVDQNIQVVICTAYSDYSWNGMIRVLGETDRLLILKKPFDNVEVRQMASALTEKWQLARVARNANQRLRQIVDERTSALREANGRLAVEIGERVRSEQALRESEARTRRLLDTALDGVVAFDSSGLIIEFNRSAETCFALPAPQAMGRLLETLIPSPEFWAEFRRGLGQFRETNSDASLKKRFELTALRADGASFPVEVSLTALAPNGDPTFVAFLRDVTERKQLQDQLAHAQRLEAVGALAGGVAHEFNNLLQAIQGYTRFAMEGLDPGDPRYQDLDQSLQVSKRAALLTRELLGFSRRQMLVRSYVSPNEIVEEVIKTLRPLIREDIEIRLTLAEDVGTIHVDPGMLQQMLLNLCLNARDAMNEGGDLVVATANVVHDEAYCQAHPDSKPGRYLLLTVSDTGCGMSRETQEHLFEPFYTTKEVGQGTGLGLAMVYGLAQQHGGAIHVYSELGLGTTCHLYLPTIEAPPPDEAPALDQEPTQTRGAETILVAEDEPLVRDLLIRILKSAGYQTLIACDGEEAVSVFEAHAQQIALALLDVVMPKMGGRAVYQAIQMLNPATKVIFCTGYDPDTNCGGFVAKEGLQLIQKPFHPAALLKTVREVLDAEQPCLAT